MHDIKMCKGGLSPDRCEGRQGSKIVRKGGCPRCKEGMEEVRDNGKNGCVPGKKGCVPSGAD